MKWILEIVVFKNTLLLLYIKDGNYTFYNTDSVNIKDSVTIFWYTNHEIKNCGDN